MPKPFIIAFYVFIISIISLSDTFGQKLPYATNSTHLTVWNGTEYIPIFIKGMNMGVAVPGTFPGELAATREQYSKWFTEIKEGGFNCIRLYTLHYPRFYEVLDSFNLANDQNPLLFIQGVWLNEELPDYNFDLAFMADTFNVEIEENVDCVHGNRFIEVRQGKAFGAYDNDVSKWCLGYIIGREIYPKEIFTTNDNNPTLTSFSGNHFSISNATASEVWCTSRLDHLVSYESQTYETQRPVSLSSWPTLDPIIHGEEINRDEDTASIDLSKIMLTDAPAGFFVSYHAYPYYPDFISDQSDYLTHYDYYGSNSYEGYLEDLKSHYEGFPLIIAEYGVPSSWGVAHYASSGMNHGGFDETGQGNTNLRMLETIENSNCGGGISFAWIDEWFKRTWVTDPLDNNPESRILWHNITAAEQNFGLISFDKKADLTLLKEFDAITSSIKAKADYNFFEFEITLNEPLEIPDELWVALDTYSDELGESQLPGGEPIPFRSEFLLHITNYSALLYVTEAYDTYGIWHGIPGPKQLYHSTTTDGAPWKIVRWKNNSGYSDVQYIGNLQVNYDFQNSSSKDAVTISDSEINVKIPWTLINVVAPNQLKVMHDDQNTYEREDTVTDGFNIGIYYKDQWSVTDERFSWDVWHRVPDSTVVETLKTSYYIMQAGLTRFNTPAIATRDSFTFSNEVYPVSVTAGNGLLKNDFDLDGQTLVALVTEPPVNGQIELNNDGSFVYLPNNNFSGTDSLMYCIYDGYSLSKSNTVVFTVKGTNTGIGDLPEVHDDLIVVYPNPATSIVTVKTKILFGELKLFNSSGQLVKHVTSVQPSFQLDLSDLASGAYFVVGKTNNKYYSAKIIKL
ncbi:Ig-like domain-containing protein [Geofilum sp. OHC36d9]|uniref:Ig-like domain-containing protein n=1 Tax=Geofilum sp. OHC36d9 TaxID=3458413 RepID=UPI00403492A3